MTSPEATEIRPEAPSLGLVIPCYNEEQVVPALLAELDRFAASWPGELRILFVDDGSRDRTFDLLCAACAADERKACLRFSRNFGHQTAVSAGLKNIQGDVVAVLDADLQDPIDLIPSMVEKWRQGYDVVYGVRQKRKENWLLRVAYRSFYRILTSMADITLPLDAGDFSLMDRRVVDEINRMPEHNRYVRGLRGWVGFRQTGIPYDRPARAGGEPKYNLRRLLRLAVDGLISFSSAPLRMAIWFGTLSASSGVLFLLYAIYSKFFRDQTPTGWTSLVILFLFFGGIQLLLLGVVGEYVARIFDEVKNRPHYIERARRGWLDRDTM
jgi:dolichol-phosphate mannosyltransferase